MHISLVRQGQTVEEMTLLELLSQSEKTLLYFYPKDNTPGCTTEAKDFSDLQEKFAALSIQVVGVSKDSEKSHCNFYEKQKLKIDLISDESLELHKRYGAWGEKKNYGKVYEGTIRSTFLLDREGAILKEWKNVRAKGHAQRVMDELGG